MDCYIQSMFARLLNIQYSIPCPVLIRSRIGLICRSKMEERSTDTNLLEKQGKYFELCNCSFASLLPHPFPGWIQQQHIKYVVLNHGLSLLLKDPGNHGVANCLIQTVFRNFTPLSRDEKSPLSPSIFLVLVGKTAEWKLSSNRLEPCF